MKLIPVGIDIAKNVFQVHYVEEETGEVISKAIKRARFLEHFARRAPCLIGMEACGGAHHWARALTRQGHRVRLMPARFVKAFNIRNKNDAADAQAIWRAVQQPGQPVAIKTETQQAMLARHRMRAQSHGQQTHRKHETPLRWKRRKTQTGKRGSKALRRLSQ
jgi:transposase